MRTSQHLRSDSRLVVVVDVCEDTPGFMDPDNYTCSDYRIREWCDDGAVGSGWKDEWGPLYPPAEEACCACGKKSSAETTCEDAAKPLSGTGLPEPYDGWSCPQFKDFYGGSCPGLISARCPKLCGECADSASGSKGQSTSGL